MDRQSNSERVGQKRRTRQALLSAARELLLEGRQLTVPEVADHAGISRATAYRYFSKPEGLAEEVALDAIASEFERLDLQTRMRDGDPESRVENVVVAVLDMVLQNEPLFRTYLGLVATNSATPRGGRRLRWLRDALAPAADSMTEADFERTVHALALLTGVETIVVLKDICSLDADEIRLTTRWVASALVREALRGSHCAPPVGAPGRL